MEGTKTDVPYFKIKEGTIYSSLVEGDLPILDRVLSIKHPKAQQIKFAAFKKHNRLWAAQWDGRVRFLKRPSNKFPSGLLRVLPELLEMNGFPKFTIDIIPSIRRIDIPEDLLDLIDKNFLNGIELYPYQIQAIKDLLRENRGVAHCATNAGKTEIATAIVKFITTFLKEVAGKSNTIFMVNTLDLLYQTKDRIKLRWPEADVGLVGHGIFDGDKDIVVATAQTLSRKLSSKNPEEKYKCKELLEKTTILLLDECHHTQSDTWKDISYSCYAMFRYGFSGTAFNREGLEGFRNFELMSVTGRKLASVRNKFLIEEGYSAKPVIYFQSVGEKEKNLDIKSAPIHPLPRTPCQVLQGKTLIDGIFLRRESVDGKKTGRSFVSINRKEELISSDYVITKCYYDLAIVGYAPRNESIVLWAQKFQEENKPALIIIKKRVHGRVLEIMLKKAGLKVQFVWGQTDPRKRIKARKKLSDGKLDALIATSIFDEGVDAPSIRAMIIAAASSSYDKNLQRIGRGLRKKKEDNTVSIVDFVDFQNQHTLKASLARLEDYESEEFTIESC